MLLCLRRAIIRNQAPALHRLAPLQRLLRTMSSHLSYTDPPPLEDVGFVAPGVVRILGQNPGRYTLEGTNTYLISSGSSSSTSASADPKPAVLVDTGEGKDAYTTLLERVLRGTNTADDQQIPASYISDMLYPTTTPPRIHKLLNPKTDSGLVEREIGPLDAPGLYLDLPPVIQDLSTLSPKGVFYALQHQQLVPLSYAFTQSSGSSIKVLHTPGHTEDHTCLLLSSRTESRLLFFAGDHVLGAGTSVFEDLRAYMDSLTVCDQELAKVSQPVPLFPGHGPVVPDGLAKVREYFQHRLEREQEIVQFLQGQGESQPKTLMEIVQKLYAAYPSSLWGAAGRGVFLHLLKLIHPDNLTAQAYGGHVEALDEITQLEPVLKSLGEPPAPSYHHGGGDNHVPAQDELDRLVKKRAEQRDKIFAQLIGTRWTWVRTGSTSSTV